MKRIDISITIRDPDESIIRQEHLLDVPDNNWVEVGGLVVNNVPRVSYRDTLNYVVSLVRKIAFDREIYLVCAAHHGRVYQKVGFDFIQVVNYRTENDWVMKLSKAFYAEPEESRPKPRLPWYAKFFEFPKGKSLTKGV